MKKILILLLLLWLVTKAEAQTTKRALFLGNSYTAYNNLAQLTSDVALSAGDTLIVDSNTPGGTTFANHSTNNTSLTKIAAGNWDYVILQEQSQIPSFPIEQVEIDCFPFAAILNDSILANNPCAETMFYMTWGRENGDAQNCGFWPPVCTYEGMDDLLYERYMLLGEMNQAVVSPVGAVWRYLRTNHPELELYASDGSHPSPLGSYAAAVCMYTAIFRNDPLNAIFDYTTDNADELIVREAVSELVYNNLQQWYIGMHDPVADFEIEQLNGLTFQLQNNSQNATSIEWLLDGEPFEPGENETIAFESSGTYEITLNAFNCGKVAAYSLTIDVIDNLVGDFSQQATVVYPNPANNQIIISGIQNSGWRLLDGTGRIIATVSAHGDVLDISTLDSGTYYLVMEEKAHKIMVLNQR
jgi:hypothetical protein